MDIIQDIENIEIKNPKMDMLYTALGFIAIAAGLLYLFRVHATLPQNLILQVPFSAQAPTDNWARNEDCEETSITMANAFLTRNTQDKLPPTAAQNAINNLKKWEGSNLGYNANTGADATTQMAEGAFGLKIRMLPDFTEEQLKLALFNNYPVLLPIDARLLPNTHYVNGGPLYHMIVLRGFKGHTFIVNDPGTDRGDGNEYTFDVLKNAAADWNNTTQMIDPNRKIALVVSK